MNTMNKRIITILVFVASCIIGLLIILSSSADAAKSNTRVTVTAYNATAGQTDSTPTIAACGSIYAKSATRYGPIAAISPNLASRFPCGSRIQVFYNNRWHSHTAWDRTSSRYRNRVDILVRTRAEAFGIGKQSGYIK